MVERPATERARPARVAIVEDDQTLLRVLSGALRDEGYDVRSTPEGDKALRIVAQDRPDLLVLDLNLPGVHGITLAAAIRDVWPEERLPIVIISALPKHVVVEAAATSRARYLLKPFDLDDLLGLVRSGLDRRA